MPDYYYRPRKNIVNRPVSLGGKGFHITGDHLQTIPNLHHAVLDVPGGVQLWPVPGRRRRRQATRSSGLRPRTRRAAPVLRAMIERYPELNGCVPDLVRAFEALMRCFHTGGTLYLCGNGGSMADALHIAGELDKSFRHPRRLSEEQRRRLLAAARRGGPGRTPAAGPARGPAGAQPGADQRHRQR